MKKSIPLRISVNVKCLYFLSEQYKSGCGDDEELTLDVWRGIKWFDFCVGTLLGVNVQSLICALYATLPLLIKHHKPEKQNIKIQHNTNKAKSQANFCDILLHFQVVYWECPLSPLLAST